MRKLIFLWSFLTLLSFSVKGQPVAAFSSETVSEACDSTHIAFTDQSTSVEDIVSWLWDFGNGVTGNTQNPQFIYYNPGTFTVCLEVTDVLGQMDITCQDITVVIDPIVLDQIQDTHVSCFGDADGAIDISLTGGISPYSYTWSNGATTEDISGLQGGIYFLTVEDSNNCISFFTFEVFESPELLVDVITGCASTGQADGSLILNVTGGVAPYIYEWNDLPGPITQQERPNLAAGFYGVTVTDANGCTAVTDATISEGNFDAVITGDFVVCQFEPIAFCAEVVNPQPGDIFSYTWTWPNGGSNATVDCIETDTFSANSEGIFSVIITNQDGCDNVQTQYINVITPDDIIVDTTSSSQSICEGETVDLMVDPVGDIGNYLYTWSPATFLNDPNLQAPVASPPITTTFTVVVTDIINGCTAQSSTTVFVDNDCVWPGDTDTNNVVNNFDLLNIGLAFDSVGPPRPNASLAWFGQTNVNWGPIPGTDVDRKHIDCDGNGIINADDTLAISMNWGLEHEFVGNDDLFELVPDFPSNGSAVTAPFYVEPDTFLENESYALSIILGEAGSEAEDVYGLGFSIEYDPSIIVPGSASIGFDGWIGELGDNMIAIQKNNVAPGVIAVGITRIDGLPMTGFGEIGQFFITIEDDILLHGGSDDRSGNGLDAIFNITNVVVINNLGEEVPTVPMETTSLVEETVVSANEINWEEYIQVQPNPTDKEFFITAKNIEIEKLSLYSITGELIRDLTPEGLTTAINTGDLITGTYLLKVQTEIGVVVEKILVSR